MDRKINYRESFRPFAPACLEEQMSDPFELDRPSPYMLMMAPVKDELCTQPKGDEADLDIQEWIDRPRSSVPAITHMDDSARIQTKSRATNPRFHVPHQRVPKTHGIRSDYQHELQGSW